MNKSYASFECVLADQAAGSVSQALLPVELLTRARQLIGGINTIAAPCGLSTTTGIGTIAALTEAGQEPGSGSWGSRSALD